MKKTFFVLLLLAVLVLLTACGPGADTTTDPLSGYNVDVNLPFATQTAGGLNSLATPKTSQVVGWMGDIITLTEDEYAELSLGSIGTKVRNLQKRLIELGYMNGTASGTFDQATALAVRLFEQAYGRQQTGKATEIMQHYLFSETVKRYSKSLATATPTVKTQATLRTLQRGDTGEDVMSLQSRLYELGYLEKVSGSYYDAATENAVKDFESAYGRSRTGIATIQLQQYLYANNAKSAWEVKTYTATPTPAPTNRYSTLRSGSKGDAVIALQNRLRELGYLRSKADGVYGDKTVEAVKAFEAAYGKQQTGIATASLQEFLFSDEAESAGSVIVTATPRATQALYTTLSRGSSGDAVYMLQQRLYALGYLSGEIDGVYGGATERAVQLFESYHGATVTGVATPNLQQFLFSDSAMVYAGAEEEDLTDDGWDWEPEELYPKLQKGDRGDDVKKLQQRLVELGYLTGTVDGYYGDGTAQAVKGFEKQYGKTQTGIATEELQKALFSDNARRNTQSEVAVSYSTLESGASGQAVSNLQQQLYQLGYYDGDITGKYDKATVQAVKDYQSAKGLNQTGIASSALQKQIFADREYNPMAPDDNYSAPTGSGMSGEAVTVNKKAYVSVSSTTVYSSLTSPASTATIKIGTEVTVLRTRGIWAEVKNQAGAVGYCLLADLTYIQSTPTKAAEKTVNVNEPALVNVDKLIVFESASDTSKKLGTLTRGTLVTWLRTRGEWAEVKNASGKIGYVKTSQLTLYDGGWGESGLVSNPYKDLNTGSKGDGVKAIQARLKELGFFYGDVGGSYKSLTTNAVKLFQEDLGMTQDGKATAGLQDILFSSYAPAHFQYKAPKAATYKDLGYNSTGTAVSNLQKKLVSLGYLRSGSYTPGTYDEATASAVLSLQKFMGLKQQDGLCTRELQAVLYSAIASKLKTN